MKTKITLNVTSIHTDFWAEGLGICNCIIFNLDIIKRNKCFCFAISYVKGFSRNMFDNATNNIFRFSLSCHSESNVPTKTLQTRTVNSKIKFKKTEY